ncbi:MAG: TIM barrel protein [Candidatus Hydrogenedentota bacterium]
MNTTPHIKTELNRRTFLASTAALGAATLLTSADVEAKTTRAVQSIGIKASLAAYSFRNVLPHDGQPGKITLHDWFEWVADQGLGAVEPTSYYFSSEDTAYLNSMKAKAFRLGLDISGTAIRNDFCHLNEAVRRESIDHVKKWCDHSMRIGAPVIRIFAGNKHAKVDDAQALTWSIECMKECCDYAGERGVFLAIENHGYLTGTSVELMKIVDGVDHEWLGVNLDTGNFSQDPYGNIERMVPHAVNVQLKVEVMKPDGKGREEADIDRVVRILRDGGYRGYIALEYESAPDPYEAVPKYLAKLQSAIEKAAE